MGVLTDPITDIDEARDGLTAALRALDAAVGSPEFKNFSAACDALDLAERAVKALQAYPTFKEGR